LSLSSFLQTDALLLKKIVSITVIFKKGPPQASLLSVWIVVQKALIPST